MHTFSLAQAAHARKVVLNLMKERRFFLFQQDEFSLKVDGDLGHHLDPIVFEDALNLDDKIRNIYSGITETAERNILSCERGLGLKEPDLSGNKRLVQCNRYTGGLDICQVYPLTAFLETLAPGTIDELRGEVNACLGDVWRELKDLHSLQAHACVVLLKTRFEPILRSTEEDILTGKLSGMPLYPHALGYLFHKYSKQNRILQHNFALFHGSSKKRVQMEHWRGSEPTLQFDATGGISNQVYVPIVA